MPNQKSWRIFRNLILAELVLYGIFLALALPFYWVEIYRHYLPALAHYIPFGVLELTGIALVQILLVWFFVVRVMVDRADIYQLIRSGEHERLEFKSTLRWDVQRGQVNKDLERSVMKTVAAFLNTEGGLLVIGVNDQGQATGLDDDINSLVKKNQDGFENHFNNLFVTMVGPELRKHVQLAFHNVAGKTVCLVSVGRAHRPAYLKTDKGEDFFIRTGNATTPLKISQAADYVSSWKRQ